MFKALVVFSAAILVSLAITPRAPVRARLTAGRMPLPHPRMRPAQDDLLLN